MIAGNAYFFRSFPTFSVPRSVGAVEISAILLRLFNYLYFKDERSIGRDASASAVSVA